MCGIVGIASPVREDPALLGRMRDRMAHRGPDDRGEWWCGEGRVGLGHRRLAVLDLTPAAHQPMADPSGRLALAFNGEIYNHHELRGRLAACGSRFRSASDTEVVLEAYRRWGAACVGHLRGMFAFAVVDAARRRVFLARDRAGEKPLFYRVHAGRLTFASELKALMADPALPREADPGALDFYLAYGFVPGEHCLLAGVRKLPPACTATYHLDTATLTVERYWELPPPPAGGPAPPGALADELEALLQDAVRGQLEADVPVGVLLSGGIDSSLVTAFAARASSHPVRTFTVAFPGHGVYDEGPHARIVARHFGTDHRVLPLEPPGVEILSELARQFDEPLADSSLVPTAILARLVRRHVTVALGGDGGDELFGGYPHYRWLMREAALLDHFPRPLTRFARAVAGTLPVGTRGRNHLLAAAGSVCDRVAHVNVYFDAATRDRLLRPYAGARPPRAPEAYKAALCAYGGTPLQKATAVDFRAYLPDDILVKVDRAAMLASLEVRAPFLDYRLVEFAFGRVPDHERVGRLGLKTLLRRVAARVLPPEMNVERKRGFSIPLAAWMRGEWGRYLRDVLRDADPRVYDPAVIAELFEGQARGRANAHRIFALAMLELWRREYAVSFHPAAEPRAVAAASLA